MRLCNVSLPPGNRSIPGAQALRNTPVVWKVQRRVGRGHHVGHHVLMVVVDKSHRGLTPEKRTLVGLVSLGVGVHGPLLSPFAPRKLRAFAERQATIAGQFLMQPVNAYHSAHPTATLSRTAALV